MAVPLLSHADTAVGNAIEAAVRTKHRRRLNRLGWGRALGVVSLAALTARRRKG